MAVYLLKTITTSYGVDAIAHVVGSYQFDQIAGVLDITIYGYAAVDGIGVAQPLTANHVRLDGANLPVEMVTRADGSQSIGLTQAGILTAIMSIPAPTDDRFVDWSTATLVSV